MRAVLFILFLLISSITSAQYKLSGTVKDNNGPVIGATVKTIDISNVSTVTDIKGYFELTVPYGKHKFVAFKLDYKRVEFEIEGPNGYDTELGSVKGGIFLGRTKKKKERSTWNRTVIDRYKTRTYLWQYGYDSFDANFSTGFNYYHGVNGCAQNYKTAYLYFMKSANGNITNNETYSYLGTMYFDGKGVDKNLQEAFKYYLIAAKRGNNEAKCLVGWMYGTGQGTTLNYEEAFKWYKDAAEMGIVTAQINLGMMYEYGKGTAKNLDKAFLWYKIAAGLGNSTGQYRLGYMYHNGYGTIKNDELAIEWLKKAIEQGNDDAEYYVGYMYFNGYGFSREPLQAIYWFKNAAEKNNAMAQHFLGKIYENGDGVEKNINEAIAWYQKAADNNYVEAKNALARLKGGKASNNKSLAKVGKKNNNIKNKQTGTAKDVAKKETTSTKTNAAPKTTPVIATTSSEAKANPSVNNSKKNITKENTALKVPNQKRIALIIGNADYPLGRLANPVNDAKDVGKKLKSLGFKTMIRTNEHRGKTRESVAEFCKQAKQYDAILFYYAGHAIQDQGVNFLVPINAKIESRADIEDECISLNWILRKMNETGVKTKIIVLDACRDNPVVNSWEQDSRGFSPEGLSAMNSVPEGTFLVYSAQAGKKAKDGVGSRNSPYTNALLKVLDIPMLPIHDVFHRVKNIVAKQTQNTQIPSQTDNLLGDFYFNLNQ